MCGAQIHGPKPSRLSLTPLYSLPGPPIKARAIFCPGSLFPPFQASHRRAPPTHPQPSCPRGPGTTTSRAGVSSTGAQIKAKSLVDTRCLPLLWSPLFILPPPVGAQSSGLKVCGLFSRCPNIPLPALRSPHPWLYRINALSGPRPCIPFPGPPTKASAIFCPGSASALPGFSPQHPPPIPSPLCPQSWSSSSVLRGLPPTSANRVVPRHTPDGA